MKNTVLVKTITQVRKAVEAAKSSGKKIGFVPTMGALHSGHGSLIETAARQCDFVVVSIFVNPTQFGPTEDLAKYPRTLDADMELCRQTGADAVFAPEANEMYSREQLTWVDVEKLTTGLCGKSRPGHFRGVTTVCAKLFNIVCPHVAFFGQKDAQQAAIIKRMVIDLNFPLEIVICPTVREKSGLAMSSRNKYLSESQRADAGAINQSLQAACQAIISGQRQSTAIIALMREILDRTGVIETEYIHIVDSESLEDVDTITRPVLIAVAAKIGATRLIDNILLDAQALK
ncbi:MAG: pantoate--beta-alanine ligase [Planctomycetes bacterium GWF2_50_10]|nr:MAG: pantoate--beta-alanine ligase [Planctomycetes bacterium GWF2_50_10]